MAKSETTLTPARMSWSLDMSRIWAVVAAQYRGVLHHLSGGCKGLTNLFRRGAAGLEVCPDRVAFGAERAGEEGGALAENERLPGAMSVVVGTGLLTNVGHDSGDDDLRLVGGFDGGAEVGVVPGVDLALALDKGRLGIHVEDLLGERAVGALRRAGE